MLPLLLKLPLLHLLLIYVTSVPLVTFVTHIPSVTHVTCVTHTAVKYLIVLHRQKEESGRDKIYTFCQTNKASYVNVFTVDYVIISQ